MPQSWVLDPNKSASKIHRISSALVFWTLPCRIQFPVIACILYLFGNSYIINGSSAIRNMNMCFEPSGSLPTTLTNIVMQRAPHHPSNEHTNRCKSPTSSRVVLLVILIILCITRRTVHTCHHLPSARRTHHQHESTSINKVRVLSKTPLLCVCRKTTQLIFDNNHTLKISDEDPCHFHQLRTSLRCRCQKYFAHHQKIGVLPNNSIASTHRHDVDLPNFQLKNTIQILSC